MSTISTQKKQADPAAPPPAERTLPWWAARLKWPAWLLAGVKVGRPVNEEFSEAEAEALAHQVAGLPLGR